MNLGLLHNYPIFAQVPAPLSRVVLISETIHDTSWTVVSHLNTTMNKGKAFGDNVQWDYQYHGSRERRGLNMGFVDGHVELVCPVNNEWGSSSPTYGNETNGGYFYVTSQFSKMKDGTWSNIR